MTDLPSEQLQIGVPDVGGDASKGLLISASILYPPRACTSC